MEEGGCLCHPSLGEFGNGVGTHNDGGLTSGPQEFP